MYTSGKKLYSILVLKRILFPFKTSKKIILFFISIIETPDKNILWKIKELVLEGKETILTGSYSTKNKANKCEYNSITEEDFLIIE